MKKQDQNWLNETILMTSIIIMIISIMCLTTHFIWDRVENRRIYEIMDRVQAKMDMYEAAHLPANIRPTEFVIIDAPVEVEPMEPVKDYLAEESSIEIFQEEVTDLDEDWYIEEIPLDKQLQKVTYDSANENNVDYLLVLAVMSEESNFNSSAVSKYGCYGLMQLNPRYFPTGLSDEENIRAGTTYLGELLKQHNGNEAAALRAYNLGYDDGDRFYSNSVFDELEDIVVMAEKGVS